MPRHGERIYKRKDGRWEGRYRLENADYPVAKYVSIYGKTYQETRKKLQHAERQQRDPANIKNKYLFENAAHSWLLLTRYKLKKSTEHRYQYLLEKHILPELGTIKLTAISPMILNDFAKKKLNGGRLKSDKKLSSSYVRSMMLIIDSIMKYAAQEHWCSPLPSTVFKPTPTPQKRTILNRKEQIELEDKLIHNINPTALGILIALQTGLRIGEICALSWNDIDIDEMVLHVRSTISRIKNEAAASYSTMLIIDSPKTKSSIRDIPLSATLCSILKKQKLISSSPFVVSESTHFISPRTFEYRYHRIMTTYQMPYINFHALRHSFATRCVECGVDIKSLSEILGHANVSVTLNTYVHSSMELKRNQLKKLSQLYV